MNSDFVIQASFMINSINYWSNLKSPNFHHVLSNHPIKMKQFLMLCVIYVTILNNRYNNNTIFINWIYPFHSSLIFFNIINLRKLILYNVTIPFLVCLTFSNFLKGNIQIYLTCLKNPISCFGFFLHVIFTFNRMEFVQFQYLEILHTNSLKFIITSLFLPDSFIFSQTSLVP